MQTEIIYNPLTDSAIVEFGELGNAELERQDFDDDIEAWVRADTPDQLVSVGVSRLASVLEDRQERLVELLGPWVVPEIERLRRETPMAERPNLDEVKNVDELRNAFEMGRSVSSTVDVPKPSPEQYQAALVGAGIVKTPAAAVIVRAVRTGLATARDRADEIRDKVGGTLQRVIPTTSVTRPRAAAAARAGGEIRERREWRYGLDNPGSLTITRRNDELHAELESLEFRGRSCELYCRFKPSIAELLNITRGEYDPQEHKLVIETEIDRDGFKTFTFARFKRRGQRLGRGELLDDFNLEVHPPTELGRILVGDTTILVLEGDILVEPVDAMINPVDPVDAMSNPVDTLREPGTDLTARITAQGNASIQTALNEWVAEHGPPAVGATLLTPANPPVRDLVHLVPPVYGEDFSANEENLRNAVSTALDAAAKAGARTVAVPPVSTGSYGYPVGEATQIITRTVVEYLRQHPDRFREIRLVGPPKPDEYDTEAPQPALEFAKALDHPDP